MRWRDIADGPFGRACIGHQPSWGETSALGLPLEQVKCLIGYGPFNGSLLIEGHDEILGACAAFVVGRREHLRTTASVVRLDPRVP
jgi:hypothetical protein